MKNKKQKELIESSVVEILLEDDGGDAGWGDTSGIGDDQGNYNTAGLGSMGGMGGGWGSDVQTGKIGGVAGIFFNPLVDIFHTLLWGLEYLSTKLKYAIASLVSTAFAAMLPFTEKNGKLGVNRAYNFIKDKEVKDLTAIDQKYKAVLDANMAALRENDVWGIMFLLNPTLMISAKLIKDAPPLAFNIIDAATAGLATTILNQIRGINESKSWTLIAEEAELDEGFFDWMKDKFKKTSDQSVNSINSPPNSEEIEKILKDPKIQEALKNSKEIKSGQVAAVNIMINRATEVLQAKTIQELSALTGRDLTNTVKTLAVKAGIKPQDIPKAEVTILSLIKDEFKKEYISGLNELTSSQPDAAGSITNAIAKINAIQYKPTIPQQNEPATQPTQTQPNTAANSK